MKPTRKRLVGIAAALSTVAIAVPASSASAATAAPAVATVPIVAAGWGGFVALPSTGPVAGQAAAVVGPTIITTAPTIFVNTNNQVAAGGAWSGGQVAR
jgi:hypothetical protein